MVGSIETGLIKSSRMASSASPGVGFEQWFLRLYGITESDGEITSAREAKPASFSRFRFVVGLGGTRVLGEFHHFLLDV